MKSIVVIGAGFAGLEFTKRLSSPEYQITLIDQTNYHLFQPLLYQVAGAQLSSTDIASPIREVLKNYPHVRVLLEEVTSIDTQKNLIHTREHCPIPYDTLVLAVGNQAQNPRESSWIPYVHKLKNLEDALKLRDQILLSYEEAEWKGKPPHFVVIGGGPTGVEMAGALAEMARRTLPKNFRKFQSGQTQLTLLEHGDYLLRAFPKTLGVYAEKTLKQMGVNVRCSSVIESISKGKIKLQDQEIEADVIIWAAGTRPTPLIEKAALPLHPDGRLIVDSFLQVQGFKNIYAVGDCAGFKQDEHLLPSLAPVAKQQGTYLARLISNKIASSQPFRYFDKGSLATIGKKRAVGQAFGLSFKGYLAWFVWAFIHIYYLVGFSSKVLIISRWFWSYLTGKRTSRLLHKTKIKN